MLDTALKILTEQVLTSRPALERPITQANYGLTAAIAAGSLAFVAIAVLGAAGCFWLLSLGLTLAPSLAIIGVLMLLASALVWQVCQNRMQRELLRQRIEAEMEAKASGQMAGADWIMMVSGMLQDTAKAFAEGLRTPASQAHPTADDDDGLEPDKFATTRSSDTH